MSKRDRQCESESVCRLKGSDAADSKKKPIKRTSWLQDTTRRRATTSLTFWFRHSSVRSINNNVCLRLGCVIVGVSALQTCVMRSDRGCGEICGEMTMSMQAEFRRRSRGTDRQRLVGGRLRSNSTNIYVDNPRRRSLRACDRAQSIFVLPPQPVTTPPEQCYVGIRTL